jgi:hypothetical protein
MRNFGYSLKLKQLIDLVCQRNFSSPLVTEENLDLCSRFAMPSSSTAEDKPMQLNWRVILKP